MKRQQQMSYPLMSLLLILSIVQVVLSARSEQAEVNEITQHAEPSFSLPALPYAYDALEPHIDAETMKIHHTKHHQTYVDNLNAQVRKTPSLCKKSLEDILRTVESLSEPAKTAVRNNAGGHYNHAFFWKVMSPRGGGKPTPLIGRLIQEKFGSFGKFKKQFNEAAKKVFGSGWAWLVLNKNNELEIIMTKNQDSPITQSFIPLLGLDVWEHAYYLKYKNKRPDYISAWWNVVNWPQVELNYKSAQKQQKKSA